MSSVVKSLIFLHLSLTVNHGEPGMAKKKKLNMSENMDTHGTLGLLSTVHAVVLSVQMSALLCCFIKIYNLLT